MHFINQIERLQKLSKLIEQEKTGTPEELAEKLGIKKRTVIDLIENIRCLGVGIKYDRKLKTYCYSNNQKIGIEFTLYVINDNELIKISGGSIFF